MRACRTLLDSAPPAASLREGEWCLRAAGPREPMCITVNLDHPDLAMPTLSLRVWHLQGHNPNAESSSSQDTGSPDKLGRAPVIPHADIQRGEGIQAGAAVQISRAHLLRCQRRGEDARACPESPGCPVRPRPARAPPPVVLLCHALGAVSRALP